MGEHYDFFQVPRLGMLATDTNNQGKSKTIQTLFIKYFALLVVIKPILLPLKGQIMYD